MPQEDTHPCPWERPIIRLSGAVLAARGLRDYPPERCDRGPGPRRGRGRPLRATHRGRTAYARAGLRRAGDHGTVCGRGRAWPPGQESVCGVPAGAGAAARPLGGGTGGRGPGGQHGRAIRDGQDPAAHGIWAPSGTGPGTVVLRAVSGLRARRYRTCPCGTLSSTSALSTALEMYRSMEMVFWLPQTRGGAGADESTMKINL